VLRARAESFHVAPFLSTCANLVSTPRASTISASLPPLSQDLAKGVKEASAQQAAINGQLGAYELVVMRDFGELVRGVVGDQDEEEEEEGGEAEVLPAPPVVGLY